MNTVLPASVEAYLKQAGFSGTEMLVLRKMLEEDSFTLRELGTKTGKSTGVLDQAMKKLLSKKIARKQIINGVPRFSIDSLEAVVRWTQDDMKNRKQILERRHQDFASFMSTLKLDKHRPDMQHFQGEEGIKKAYEKLLESGSELLTFTPILNLAEDDPLRAFRVDYFRIRQCRKIFQRVLAPDTPLARRFQSRDAFEYRKTLLLPAAEYPMAFERTIVSGTVACFNFTDQSVCFVEHKDLAASERLQFETMWSQALAREKVGAEQSSTLVPVAVPLSTKILSSFRQFFLGQRSFLALVLFALISAALTFGLYKSNRNLNLQRLKDRVISIASTGALQFDSADIDAIWKPEDIAKPEYAKIVATLNMIRRNNSDIQYAYIWRKTDDPTKVAFVGDADSLNPSEKKDLNHDDVIDAADALNTPGDLYDTSDVPFIMNGFQKAISGLATDQWGTFISGYAPMRDKKGNVIAILGIDVFAHNLDRLAASSFTPLWAFIGFFVLLLLIRFWAENRSLMNECWGAAMRNVRKTFIVTTFVVVLIAGTIFGFRQYQFHLAVRQTGERLMAIAVTAATQFDPDDLDRLHWARDMKTEAYQRVFRELNDIRNKNPTIKFAYIYRPTSTKGMYEFIADADSNYNLPNLWVDFDHNGQLDNSDVNLWPGMQYSNAEEDIAARATMKPSFGVSYDQWGYFVSGLAPIFDFQKRLIGFLGLDIDMGEVGRR